VVVRALLCRSWQIKSYFSVSVPLAVLFGVCLTVCVVLVGTELESE
jgi:hypothetical protein